MTADRGLTIEVPPPAVGYYSVGKTHPYHFAFTSKPAWWHRFWTRVFLGWRWSDLKSNKEADGA